MKTKTVQYIPESKRWIVNTQTGDISYLIKDDKEAALIAAAPELLGALKILVLAIAPDYSIQAQEPHFHNPLNKALSAIAKAEGRSI